MIGGLAWKQKRESTLATAFQEKGVIEEYRKAKVVGHTTLAQGIRGANPDLTKEFDKVDKAL